MRVPTRSNFPGISANKEPPRNSAAALYLNMLFQRQFLTDFFPRLHRPAPMAVAKVAFSGTM